MKLPISKEKEPIERKFEHWALFLGTRNRLSNAREDTFPGRYGLSCEIDMQCDFEKALYATQF